MKHEIFLPVGPKPTWLPNFYRVTHFIILTSLVTIATSIVSEDVVNIFVAIGIMISLFIAYQCYEQLKWKSEKSYNNFITRFPVEYTDKSRMTWIEDIEGVLYHNFYDYYVVFHYPEDETLYRLAFPDD
jgi:hypothetical protein